MSTLRINTTYRLKPFLKMPAKAKLYSTESGFRTAVETLEDHFGLNEGQWCPTEQVQNGDDEGKFILPLPTHGSFKADHLLSGTVDYDGAWLNSE